MFFPSACTNTCFVFSKKPFVDVISVVACVWTATFRIHLTDKNVYKFENEVKDTREKKKSCSL